MTEHGQEILENSIMISSTLLNPMATIFEPSVKSLDPAAAIFELNPALPSHEEEMELVCDELEKLEAGVREPSITNGILETDIQGAIVTFSQGAEVTSVKLPADFSFIQVFGLNSKINNATVTTFLFGLLRSLGIENRPLSIRLSSRNNSRHLAIAKFDGPETAKKVVERFESIVGPGERNEVMMREVMGHRKFGKHIQLNTIVCSWHKTTMKAWLTYKSEESFQRAKMLLSGFATPAGNILLVLGLEPKDIERKRGLHILQVNNLDENASKGFFDFLPESDRPWRVRIKPSEHSVSTCDAESTLSAFLSSVGLIYSSKLYKDPRSLKVKFTVTFFHAQDADRAIQTLMSNPPESIPRLSVTNITSLRYSIPNRILKFIQVHLDEFMTRITTEGLLKIKISPSTDSGSYSFLALYGQGKQAAKTIAAARGIVDTLLAGVTVCHGGKPLWRSYFMVPSYLHTLAQISRRNKLYIHRDMKKRKLIMYGGLEEQHKAVEDLVSNMHLIPTELEETQALLVKGVPPSDAILPEPKDCIICFNQAISPVETSCGHFYCQDCFIDKARAADDHSFPIRCDGADGRCNKIFQLEELKLLVPLVDFHGLLARSFVSYITTHPEEFFFCPSTDCESIFRPLDQNIPDPEKPIYCFDCLTHICAVCRAVAHENLSCVDSKSATLDQARFEAFKAENDVKDCPRCAAPIQKDEGCNHMECWNCHGDFCWLCMARFGSSRETYDHLTAAHGGWGVADPPNEVEVEVE